MSALRDKKNIYFIGIGGIGMSALARYLMNCGYRIGGYDRTETSLTNTLENDGIEIQYKENVENLPVWLKSEKDKSLVIYTPAIPPTHASFIWLKAEGYKIIKRSELLGEITQNAFTVGVAGTHGKTTTSTILSHLLKSGAYNCTAFLGGISKNQGSNFIGNTTNQAKEFVYDKMSPVVVEADEYDRSFLTLSPDIAIITSVDADHLDIYGTQETLKESFALYSHRVKEGGALLVKKGLDFKPIVKEGVKVYEYSLNEEADFTADNVSIKNGKYVYKFKAMGKVIGEFELGMPGLHNVENSIAACGAATLMGEKAEDLFNGLKTFKGVSRRFDYRINTESLTYIDDYAHHPAEIRSCISSVRQLFPNSRITGIFQPHLFSRTRDFLEEFAKELSELDEVILMEIYPARELPIPGINSSLLLNKIKSPLKSLLNKEAILSKMKDFNTGVLLTIGAGDIDTLVEPLEKLLIKNT